MNNSSRSERSGARREDDSEESGPAWWGLGLGLAAGVAAVAGGIYMLSQQSEQPHVDSEDEEDSEVAVTMDTVYDAVTSTAVEARPKVSNLNSLLEDIHVRYIAIRKIEFGQNYNVFRKVFDKLHNSMKAVDSYYKRYSSRLHFRPEEFSIYIVIRLPLNERIDYLNPEESDIIIEPKHAGYVQLRAGKQYLKIIKRDDYDINKQAFFWLDEKKYILRSKFFSWFESVVDQALNSFGRCVRIDGIHYKITMSRNGAACTLWITNTDGFRLNVNLVPELRFPENRWLGSSKSYRDIPYGCNVGYWTVMPKPNNFGANSYDENRSWHVDMHNQEEKFIYDSFHLRQGIRLLKKLCNGQQMVEIENYYIKTLFMWKHMEISQTYWQQDVATIFKDMLGEFHKALVNRKIQFFWKKKNNLIENVPENILKGYERKLLLLITDLEDDNNYMAAAKYLLTKAEFAEYQGLLHNTIM